MARPRNFSREGVLEKALPVFWKQGFADAILPPEAIEILGQSRVQLKQLIARNIEAEKPEANVDELAGMVLTFFGGLSMEQNLKSSRAANGRKVDGLMRVLRRL